MRKTEDLLRALVAEAIRPEQAAALRGIEARRRADVQLAATRDFVDAARKLLGAGVTEVSRDTVTSYVEAMRAAAGDDPRADKGNDVLQAARQSMPALSIALKGAQRGAAASREPISAEVGKERREVRSLMDSPDIVRVASALNSVSSKAGLSTEDRSFYEANRVAVNLVAKELRDREVYGFGSAAPREPEALDPEEAQLFTGPQPTQRSVAAGPSDEQVLKYMGVQLPEDPAGRDRALKSPLIRRRLASAQGRDARRALSVIIPQAEVLRQLGVAIDPETADPEDIDDILRDPKNIKLLSSPEAEEIRKSYAAAYGAGEGMRTLTPPDTRPIRMTPVSLRDLRKKGSGQLISPGDFSRLLGVSGRSRRGADNSHTAQPTVFTYSYDALFRQLDPEYSRRQSAVEGIREVMARHTSPEDIIRIAAEQGDITGKDKVSIRALSDAIITGPMRAQLISSRDNVSGPIQEEGEAPISYVLRSHAEDLASQITSAYSKASRIPDPKEADREAAKLAESIIQGLPRVAASDEAGQLSRALAAIARGLGMDVKDLLFMRIKTQADDLRPFMKSAETNRQVRRITGERLRQDVPGARTKVITVPGLSPDDSADELAIDDIVIEQMNASTRRLSLVQSLLDISRAHYLLAHAMEVIDSPLNTPGEARMIESHFDSLQRAYKAHPYTKFLLTDPDAASSLASSVKSSKDTSVEMKLPLQVAELTPDSRAALTRLSGADFVPTGMRDIAGDILAGADMQSSTIKELLGFLEDEESLSLQQLGTIYGAPKLKIIPDYLTNDLNVAATAASGKTPIVFRSEAGETPEPTTLNVPDPTDAQVKQLRDAINILIDEDFFRQSIEARRAALELESEVPVGGLPRGGDAERVKQARRLPALATTPLRIISRALRLSPRQLTERITRKVARLAELERSTNSHRKAASEVYYNADRRIRQTGQKGLQRRAALRAAGDDKNRPQTLRAVIERRLSMASSADIKDTPGDIILTQVNLRQGAVQVSLETDLKRLMEESGDAVAKLSLLAGSFSPYAIGSQIPTGETLRRMSNESPSEFDRRAAARFSEEYRNAVSLIVPGREIVVPGLIYTPPLEDRTATHRRLSLGRGRVVSLESLSIQMREQDFSGIDFEALGARRKVGGAGQVVNIASATVEFDSKNWRVNGVGPVNTSLDQEAADRLRSQIKSLEDELSSFASRDDRPKDKQIRLKDLRKDLRRIEKRIENSPGVEHVLAALRRGANGVIPDSVVSIDAVGTLRINRVAPAFLDTPRSRDIERAFGIASTSKSALVRAMVEVMGQTYSGHEGTLAANNWSQPASSTGRTLSANELTSLRAITAVSGGSQSSYIPVSSFQFDPRHLGEGGSMFSAGVAVQPGREGDTHTIKYSVGGDEVTQTEVTITKRGSASLSPEELRALTQSGVKRIGPLEMKGEEIVAMHFSGARSGGESTGPYVIKVGEPAYVAPMYQAPSLRNMSQTRAQAANEPTPPSLYGLGRVAKIYRVNADTASGTNIILADIEFRGDQVKKAGRRGSVREPSEMLRGVGIGFLRPLGPQIAESFKRMLPGVHASDIEANYPPKTREVGNQVFQAAVVTTHPLGVAGWTLPGDADRDAARAAPPPEGSFVVGRTTVRVKSTKSDFDGRVGVLMGFRGKDQLTPDQEATMGSVAFSRSNAIIGISDTADLDRVSRIVAEAMRDMIGGEVTDKRRIRQIFRHIDTSITQRYLANPKGASGFLAHDAKTMKGMVPLAGLEMDVAEMGSDYVGTALVGGKNVPVHGAGAWDAFHKAGHAVHPAGEEFARLTGRRAKHEIVKLPGEFSPGTAMGCSAVLQAILEHGPERTMTAEESLRLEREYLSGNEETSLTGDIGRRAKHPYPLGIHTDETFYYQHMKSRFAHRGGGKSGRTTGARQGSEAVPRDRVGTPIGTSFRFQLSREEGLEYTIFLRQQMRATLEKAQVYMAQLETALADIKTRDQRMGIGETPSQSACERVVKGFKRSVVDRIEQGLRYVQNLGVTMEVGGEQVKFNTIDALRHEEERYSSLGIGSRSKSQMKVSDGLISAVDRIIGVIHDSNLTSSITDEPAPPGGFLLDSVPLPTTLSVSGDEAAPALIASAPEAASTGYPKWRREVERVIAELHRHVTAGERGTISGKDIIKRGAAASGLQTDAIMAAISKAVADIRLERESEAAARLPSSIGRAAIEAALRNLDARLAEARSTLAAVRASLSAAAAKDKAGARFYGMIATDADLTAAFARFKDVAESHLKGFTSREDVIASDPTSFIVDAIDDVLGSLAKREMEVREAVTAQPSETEAESAAQSQTYAAPEYTPPADMTGFGTWETAVINEHRVQYALRSMGIPDYYANIQDNSDLAGAKQQYIARATAQLRELDVNIASALEAAKRSASRSLADQQLISRLVDEIGHYRKSLQNQIDVLRPNNQSAQTLGDELARHAAIHAHELYRLVSILDAHVQDGTVAVHVPLNDTDLAAKREHEELVGDIMSSHERHSLQTMSLFPSAGAVENMKYDLEQILRMTDESSTSGQVCLPIQVETMGEAAILNNLRVGSAVPSDPPSLMIAVAAVMEPITR